MLHAKHYRALTRQSSKRPFALYPSNSVLLLSTSIINSLLLNMAHSHPDKFQGEDSDREASEKKFVDVSKAYKVYVL